MFEEFENKCFYCGKPVTKRTVHVDHFIPWSFIKDDNLWNFVLACPACNERKNDRLAPKPQLDLLLKRNQILVMEPQKDKLRKLMGNYQEERLVNIYAWATNNGYKDIWIPPQREVHVNG